MAKRTTIIFPDNIAEYLEKASEEEERTVTEIVMEAIRLRKLIKTGTLYMEENGQKIRIMVL